MFHVFRLGVLGKGINTKILIKKNTSTFGFLHCLNYTTIEKWTILLCCLKPQNAPLEDCNTSPIEKPHIAVLRLQISMYTVCGSVLA